MNKVAVYQGLALLFALVFFTSTASAHEPHKCPDGFPDSPNISAHITQEKIASGEITFEEIYQSGQLLFETMFNICDGQGRPATTGGGDKRAIDQPAFIRTSSPDSNSCAGCHNQPRSGGGGDFVANVFVLAQALDPITESVSPDFSNERNTIGMFGAGPIEMLGREMTTDLQAQREAVIREAQQNGKSVTQSLTTKGVQFGRITAHPDGSVDTSALEGIDADLVVKPFHQAGVVRSIREFTVNAMNHHHGMQAEERFDLNSDKGVDFDEDGVVGELTVGDITAVTIFQAALSTPGRIIPNDESDREIVENGEMLFVQLGCTSCHIPELTLRSPYFVEPAALNPPGTYNDPSQIYAFDMTQVGQEPRLEKTQDGGAILRPYTDLKRHNLCDDHGQVSPIRYYCNEGLAQGRPEQNGKPGSEYFITRKLWDVGNSAPYGHRGDLTTITEAILYHGGEARVSRDRFAAASVSDQESIIKFLKTLQVLPGESAVVDNAPRPAVGQYRHLLWGLIPFNFLAMFLVWRKKS